MPTTISLLTGKIEKLLTHNFVSRIVNNPTDNAEKSGDSYAKFDRSILISIPERGENIRWAKISCIFKFFKKIHFRITPTVNTIIFLLLSQLITIVCSPIHGLRHIDRRRRPRKASFSRLEKIELANKCILHSK